MVVVGAGGAGLLRCPLLEEFQMPSLEDCEIQPSPLNTGARATPTCFGFFFSFLICQNVGMAFLGKSFPGET